MSAPTSDTWPHGMPEVMTTWRGPFMSAEFVRVHDAAFGLDRPVDESWDYRTMVERHSLGWVTARENGELIGFANVPWDGGIHAWLQDVVVAPNHHGRGVGKGLVAAAATAAREAGCEWLHVDFDDDVAGFYVHGCGFTPTAAGLLSL